MDFISRRKNNSTEIDSVRFWTSLLRARCFTHTTRHAISMRNWRRKRDRADEKLESAFLESNFERRSDECCCAADWNKNSRSRLVGTKSAETSRPYDFPSALILIHLVDIHVLLSRSPKLLFPSVQIANLRIFLKTPTFCFRHLFSGIRKCFEGWNPLFFVVKSK